MTKKIDLDYDFSLPSVVVGVDEKELKKKRNFPGSYTKNAYGPANAPKVANGKGLISTIGYGTPADPVSFGDGGGALGEAREEKFMSFLESLSDKDNSNIIDAIKQGFDLCNKK